MSISADRAGQFVNWPAAPAGLLRAGWALPLDYRGDQLVTGTRRRTEFDGLLQPAGLIDHLHVVPESGPNGPEYWYGASGRPLIPIRLFIDYGRGNRVTTRTEVALSAAGG
jgi:hypothetical protein